MTTMYHINEKQFEFTSIPVEPVFVNIPFEVLKELNLDPKKESSYQSICVFGKMTIETDDSRLIIDRTVQQCEEKEANIRLLPTYFISGYIDTKSNEFIENPNYFSNLSEQEKNSIIQVLKNQKEQLEQRNQNQKS